MSEFSPMEEANDMGLSRSDWTRASRRLSRQSARPAMGACHWYAPPFDLDKNHPALCASLGFCPRFAPSAGARLFFALLIPGSRR